MRYRPCRRVTYTGGDDAAFHARYKDGMGIKVKKRKNDTAGRGLVTRVPGSHLQRVMMAYSQEQRLDISPRCTKTDSPGAHSYCPPFFPKVVLLPGHAPPQRANGADARVAMTRQNVTEAIVMEMLCVDSRQFSNVITAANPCRGAVCPQLLLRRCLLPFCIFRAGRARKRPLTTTSYQTTPRYSI